VTIIGIAYLGRLRPIDGNSGSLSSSRASPPSPIYISSSDIVILICHKAEGVRGAAAARGGFIKGSLIRLILV
jgi:hypothetical protein